MVAGPADRVGDGELGIVRAARGVAMTGILPTLDSAARAAVGALGVVPPESALRALRDENTGRYKLGRGGTDPRAPSPLDADGYCDCSGALCYWWGEPRRDAADGEDDIDGEWLYTTSIYLAAKRRRHGWIEVAPADVRAGDGLVYRGGLPGQRVGHCALVIARPAIVRTFADVTVIDCASRPDPAIRRRTGALWDRKSGIAVRRV